MDSNKGKKRSVEAILLDSKKLCKDVRENVLMYFTKKGDGQPSLFFEICNELYGDFNSMSGDLTYKTAKALVDLAEEGILVRVKHNTFSLPTCDVPHQEVHPDDGLDGSTSIIIQPGAIKENMVDPTPTSTLRVEMEIAAPKIEYNNANPVIGTGNGKTQRRARCSKTATNSAKAGVTTRSQAARASNQHLQSPTRGSEVTATANVCKKRRITSSWDLKKLADLLSSD